MTCPLLYRFRVIDRLPERPSAAAARGTLVHAVLERLFDLPGAGRTPEAAVELLAPEWERLLEAEPELAALFEPRATPGRRAGGVAGRPADGGAVLHAGGSTAAGAGERELFVETVLESGLKLRGYIDRVDVAPTGDVRVVDYKTGRRRGRISRRGRCSR